MKFGMSISLFIPLVSFPPEDQAALRKFCEKTAAVRKKHRGAIKDTFVDDTSELIEFAKQLVGSVISKQRFYQVLPTHPHRSSLLYSSIGEVEVLLEMVQEDSYIMLRQLAEDCVANALEGSRVSAIEYCRVEDDWTALCQHGDATGFVYSSDQSELGWVWEFPGFPGEELLN